ncbi:ABC transporter ATP-binding protein [uncultured Tateyamaria sp.]|uniref:ABC transporter ATP-binding protein n=1 Tax=uncultured Tateyamaria sp. TaxID=455651 RepID=UPI002634A2A6|nr:ABC transporter ATP-binding protein [uncultured Tateyamaria sp.]
MTAADLAVQGVSWAPAKTAQPVLHPTTFHVAAGRILGVVGPNGAGKSTLLRLLYRFQRPHTGQVHVGGQDIWSMTARESARRIAAVLQEQASAFGLTVREIVRLGRTPHVSGFAAGGARSEAVVNDVLATLNLDSLADRDFGTLSGGERQRVMVARALVQEPQVLILDEPTNHLDVRHQLEVVSLIRSLGLTIVVSLHDLNMAAGICDDVLVLNDGFPQGFGPPQSLLTDQLVSDTFRVAAQREHLSLSGAAHFSFTLPN